MRRPERLLLWLSQENNSGRWIPQRLVRSSRLGDYWGEGEGTKKEGRGGLFVASSFSQQVSLKSGRVGSDLTCRQETSGSYGSLGQRNGPMKDIILFTRDW